MSSSWQDYECMEVIKKWRDKKVVLTIGKYKTKISRRLMLSIINHIFKEGASKITEEYDTEFVPDKGFVPPILQDWQKDPERGLLGARSRLPEEILDANDWKGMGRTAKEILAYRKEAEELCGKLEASLDICPRCKSPNKHCSRHC